MYFFTISYSFGFISGCCCRKFFSKNVRIVEQENSDEHRELTNRYVRYLERIIFNMNEVTPTEINIINTQACLSPLASINEQENIENNQNMEVSEMLPQAEIIR